MLETDEVDIDYFTPAARASLASIFGKSAVAEETKENTSLKYVPPPPPEKSKLEEVKPTQWIFTCAVQGFEWINSKYISKGKLGLAMYKTINANCSFFILYDSNKTTVSCVEISSKLNIHIRDASTISYYDNAQKYWSIKTSNDDMNKILQVLKDSHATIIPESCQENNVEHNNSKICYKDEDVVIKEKEQKEEHETDTDFYNQKTKDSILKRMANMGHSVLPQQGNLKGHASDSSDSNDTEDIKKNIRHKVGKVPSKKSTDINVQENESNLGSHVRKVSHRIHSEGQSLVPSKNTTKTLCGGDMNIFISEQKISNSELRINVNRVSDKLDIVLERLNDITSLDKNNSLSSFQNNIVQKLLSEYESKIMYYECVMNSRGIDFHSMKSPAKSHVNEKSLNSCTNDNVEHMIRVNELEKECRQKDNIIKELEQETHVLNEYIIKTNERNQEKMDELQIKIEKLNENLNLKNKEIDSSKSNHQECFDITNKVKKIMNDTFDAISSSFNDQETYSGETIKAIIGRVIKKTTIQALQEL